MALTRLPQLFWALMLVGSVVVLFFADSVLTFVISLQEGARELGWVAIALWLPAYVLIALGLPANTVSCVMAGLFYGWWAVLLCVGWGALCASSIGFLLCRRLGRARIEGFVASRRPLAALKLAVEERALLVTAVARCCPVIPFGQCTLVLSVSRIEVRSTLACNPQKLCLLGPIIFRWSAAIDG